MATSGVKVIYNAVASIALTTSRQFKFIDCYKIAPNTCVTRSLCYKSAIADDDCKWRREHVNYQDRGTCLILII